jgi:DNA/RNA endonuclease G (NUC1)
VFATLLGLVVLSCTDSPTAVRTLAPNGRARANVTPIPGPVLISQIYGGGGNSGATLKNDFVELFNPGTETADVGGWSVQYTSAAGSSAWQVTGIPAGTVIPAGGYLLVQEAFGNGGSANLPTPDVIGTIGISGTDGKVALVSDGTALNGSCPNGPSTIDLVSFGSGNCFPTDGGAAPTLSNTTAAFRALNGCAYTSDPAADFVTGSPAPRNSQTALNPCPAPQPAVTLTFSPDSTGVTVGMNVKLHAIARDAAGVATNAVVSWLSSDPRVATVSQFGLVTGISEGFATITATTDEGVTATAKISVSAAAVVISQVYGGGGNSGAKYKNDFIELFNRSTQPVSVNGWSVQYASAAGGSWQVTNLAGTIAPGGYYLVQEAAGSGGTTALPAADASGSINMSGTDGKVALVKSTDALNGCPAGGALVDLATFGSANCLPAMPTLSNTTSGSRSHGGCTFTGLPIADFATGAVAPRNSASALHSCVAGPLDHVTVSGDTLVVTGTTTKLTAAARDANELDVANAQISWSSSDPSIATVDDGGLVTGLVSSDKPLVITVTAIANGVTRSATYQMTVDEPGIHWIDVSTSGTSFPPGFQTQLFATARDKSRGTIIPATFTFEPVDPQYADIQTVQNTGIITAVSAPTDGSKPGFRITATPVAGGKPYVFITRPITVEVPSPAPASSYARNDEFGDPTAANGTTANDLLIMRPQYTLSYNESRGTPNWVSYELDSRQMVAGQDRCNCFTADPLLPADKQIFTSDYASGGFDRGHMTRSADRTAGNVDNAATFYLTNVVPQQADLNQGVWAQFENALADSATAGGRAVYIITGPLYSRSRSLAFLKNEGKVAIPDSTWKIAFIGPRTAGAPFTRADIKTWDDLAGTTVLAVNMPNVAGVRNDPWQKYLTTVDKIETATGFDFLSLLPSAFQSAVEAGDRAPTARFTASGTANEGNSMTFDASAASDPDVGRVDLDRTETLTYVWYFSDGTTANGKTVTHAFAKYGSYTAALTVTDAFGWQSVSTQGVAVADVAPELGTLADTALLQGETYLANWTFVDPGSDPFTATVNFGDGASAALMISGRNLHATHVYTAAGAYTATAMLSDGQLASTTSANVLVQTPLQGVDNLSDAIDALASLGVNALRAAVATTTIHIADQGKTSLDASDVKQLHGKLDNAKALIAKSNNQAATNQLLEFIRDLQMDSNDGKVSGAAISPIVAYAQRVIASVNR